VTVHPIRDAILKGTLCAHLRTKGMFVSGYDGPPPDLPFPADTAVFWCNRTGWAMGPDDLPANPDRCSRPRGCFEPEIDA
jgi:hypothetical protein